MEAPPNGWFRNDYIVENPIEMDDLGVPLFCEISIYWIGHASKSAGLCGGNINLATSFFGLCGLLKTTTKW